MGAQRPISPVRQYVQPGAAVIGERSGLGDPPGSQGKQVSLNLADALYVATTELEQARYSEPRGHLPDH